MAVSPSAPLEDYPRFRQRLLTGVMFLIIMLALVFGWMVWNALQKDREAARLQTKTFARAIDAHVHYTIESIDLSLISFVNAGKALSSEAEWNSRLIERLLNRSFDIDGHFWLLFIDAQGKGVAASSEIDVLGRSFADQDYFRAHIRRGSGLFVGGPHIDPLTRRPMFVVSRRVESASGRFLGVIAVPINARRFSAMFADARYDKDVTIALTHFNGKIIARSPLTEEAFGMDVPNGWHVRNAPRWAEDTWEDRSKVDGVERIYSYRRLDGLPLVVSVGVANPFITESARYILLFGGLGLLLMASAVLGSCHFVLKSYRGLEAMVEARTAQLNQSRTALRALVAHQNRVKERERTRIAREVHDELGGCLTGIKAYLSAASEAVADETGKAIPSSAQVDSRSGCGPGDARNGSLALLSEASKLTDAAVDTVRRVISDLRPSVLDQLGVWAALEWHADQFEQRTGIRCELALDGLPDREVDCDTANMIYRIVQESLTNVARHAQANRVSIRGVSQDGGMVIEIEDNGVGIAASELLDQESWGIMGMHERARHGGAELKVNGSPGKGTLVRLVLKEGTRQDV